MQQLVHLRTLRMADANSGRYEAFAAGINRGDKSAQASGAKILESLAILAVQESLKLRNSLELR